jgi:hypothetical protein
VWLAPPRPSPRDREANPRGRTNSAAIYFLHFTTTYTIYSYRDSTHKATYFQFAGKHYFQKNAPLPLYFTPSVSNVYAFTFDSRCLVRANYLSPVNPALGALITAGLARVNRSSKRTSKGLHAYSLNSSVYLATLPQINQLDWLVSIGIICMLL